MSNPYEYLTYLIRPSVYSTLKHGSISAFDLNIFLFIILIYIFSPIKVHPLLHEIHTVKPVYKGHSWEPENVVFMSHETSLYPQHFINLIQRILLTTYRNALNRLSTVHRYTDYVFTFGIFKLFLIWGIVFGHYKYNNHFKYNFMLLW